MNDIAFSWNSKTEDDHCQLSYSQLLWTKVDNLFDEEKCFLM